MVPERVLLQLGARYYGLRFGQEHPPKKNPITGLDGCQLLLRPEGLPQGIYFEALGRVKYNPSIPYSRRCALVKP
jgi:hypothetical protein